MQSLVFLMIVLAAVSSVSARIISNRIVGGTDAAEGEYPYVVSLRIGYHHFCGGSIINKRWILTAAHCIQRTSARVIKVVAGTNDVMFYGDQYQADLVLLHPDYTEGKYIADICLIRVDTDIVFKSKVQPIKLPDGDFTKENYPARMTGWGNTWIGSPMADRLKYIDLIVMAQSSCMKHEPSIMEDQICTFTKAGQGACFGDSGGPLTADGVQIGIVSYGILPCARGAPDVYTRVWTYIDWINQNAKVE